MTYEDDGSHGGTMAASEFSNLIDLAAARTGGRAIETNDDFFAPMENLLKPGRGVFIPDKYTERGKWMDGWESRRRREPGHDWCIIQLGMPGVIHAFNVDTNHFRGNHPEACSIDIAEASGDGGELRWTELLARSELQGHSENIFSVDTLVRATHVRLNIHPDGGVARLRVLGVVTPDWPRIIQEGHAIDLVAVEHGGTIIDCSDMFFSHPLNLIMPGRSDNMGDGWETRRRRGPGHDWVVLKLGRPGTIEEIEVDTNHFKGNYPDRCSIEACSAHDAPTSETAWSVILPEQKLSAHHQHRYNSEIQPHDAITHVRLNMFPDGGISRLRLRGRVAEMGAS